MSDYVVAGALAGAAGALGTAYRIGTLGTTGIGGTVGIAVGGAVIGAVAVLAAPLLGYLANEAFKYMSVELHALLTNLVDCMVKKAQKYIDFIKSTEGQDREEIIKGFCQGIDKFVNEMEEAANKVQNKDVADKLRALNSSFAADMKKAATEQTTSTVHNRSKHDQKIIEEGFQESCEAFKDKILDKIEDVKVKRELIAKWKGLT